MHYKLLRVKQPRINLGTPWITIKLPHQFFSIRASDNEFSLGGQMPKSLPVEQNYVFYEQGHILKFSCFFIMRRTVHKCWHLCMFFMHVLSTFVSTCVHDISCMFVLCSVRAHITCMCPSSGKCKAVRSVSIVKCSNFHAYFPTIYRCFRTPVAC